jgi:hypothetical protein
VSAITEALERRAIDVYTDLNTALLSEPDGADKQLMESAVAHLITSSLLLKATTEEFKAQMATNQMKGTNQC